MGNALTMFDRIRKAFSKQPYEDGQGLDSLAQTSEMSHGPVSQWAATQGFEFWAQGLGQSFAVRGQVGGKAWQLELGPPSRSYVVGEELRARADLGLAGDTAVVVMSRQLKESIQLQAKLPAMPGLELGEEADWLARFPEVRWDGAPEPLWSRFAVLADRQQDAAAWLEPELLRQLLTWPLPGVTPDVPFLLLFLRGKVTLRMEYRPSDLPTLHHAAAIFTNACESALARFPAPACCPEPLVQSH
jgi:hypothetical protein